MALTKTEITNRALSKIGENAIQDFDSNEENSVRAKIIFDEAVEEVIGEGNWSSVTYRRKLPIIQVDDETREIYPDYISFHPLPVEPRFARVSRIFNYPYDYLVHENKLITNSYEPIVIEYVGIPKTLENINVYLRGSIVDRLAFKLSMIITDKIKFFELLRDNYYVNLQRNLNRDYVQSNRTDRVSRMSSVIIRAGY